MRITEALLAEHLVFHNLFDYVERVAPEIQTLAEVKSLAALMEALLKAHSQTEDELLLSPLEHCFEQIGQSEMLRQEHEEIGEDLLMVQKAKHVRKARELLIAVVISSRKHFDKEERIIFPMAEQVLKSETLEELGEIWSNQRNQPVE